jgi:hypothetical protein
VESKWKNYHITTFPGQSLSKTGLSLEEAMDLSRDRQIEENRHNTHEQYFLVTWQHRALVRHSPPVA